MFACPNCHSHLSRLRGDNGLVWACGQCKGKGMTLPVLEKVCERDHRNLIWWASHNDRARRVRTCFHCEGKMTEVADIPADRGPDLTLDMCRTCHFVWFDPGEFDRLPKQQPVARADAARRELSPEAREVIALHEVDRINREMRGSTLQESAAGPEEAWKWIPGLLGLPVQYDVESVARPPLITWSLMALIAAVSLLAFPNLGAIVAALGFVPAEALRHGGFTLMSSFFLHGGIVHLLVNLYFLFTFGDNVEDFLGRARYLFLIALAGLVGTAAHWISDPASTIPVIGASGGISGILAFYACSFPRARIGLTHWWFRGLWLSVPVWLAFVGWLLIQSVGVWQQLSGWSQVSAFSHVGGALAGFFLWLVWRHQDTQNSQAFTAVTRGVFPREQ